MSIRGVIMGALVALAGVAIMGATMAASDGLRLASAGGTGIFQQLDGGIGGLTDSPTAAMLGTVIGIATIVTVLINLTRALVTPGDFDRFAPIGAVIVGVGLALLGELQRGGTTYVDAALVGLFGGMSSQLVNKIGVRTVQAVRGDPPV